ncbi:hypothetical protein B0919_03300 [Hymenobacter sp. CRA2]|nr:hypothetical protein B0919_03300 [Hymenobacter sp. CRA2]
MAVAASSSSAVAQSATAAATLPPLASLRYSAADTIRAVQHLFTRRLKGAAGYVGGGSATLSKAAVGMALRNDSTSQGQRIDTNQDVLGGGLMLGYGLWRTQRFGPERYAQIVAAYQQGEPLPGYVRRRLKTKYFRYRAF